VIFLITIKGSTKIEMPNPECVSTTLVEGTTVERTHKLAAIQ